MIRHAVRGWISSRPSSYPPPYPPQLKTLRINIDPRNRSSQKWWGLDLVDLALATPLRKAENDVSHSSTGSPGERETGKKMRSKVDAFDPKSYAALPGTLLNASTFDLGQKVHACAVELNDKRLLVNLASGDLMPQEAKYHTKCLVSLYNRCRLAVNKRQGKNKKTVCEGLALADIIWFIEETLAVTNESHPVYRMSDLRKMYLS